MDLNTIFLSLFGVMFLYAGYTAWISPIPVTFNPVRNGLLVAQDVGKSKQIQSKTGDTSLHIEKLRRQAIKTVGSYKPFSIKETKYQVGSTTGAIETFLIGRSKA
jgi:hypothetical protein